MKRSILASIDTVARLLLIAIIALIAKSATAAETGKATPLRLAYSAITVNQTSTASGLYPGGPAATLSGNFDNPNASSVKISSITAAIGSISNGSSDGSKPACTASDFSIGGSVGTATVPSGNGVGSWSGLTIQLLNTAANQDNCKGATANINYTANP